MKISKFSKYLAMPLLDFGGKSNLAESFKKREKIGDHGGWIFCFLGIWSSYLKEFS